jgi:uncharacterized protein
VFEAGSRPGGHAHTVSFDLDGRSYDADVGFMVFNDRTYPTLQRLFDRWGITARPSTMSFGVSCERTGTEWAGTGVAGVFAQPRALASVAHWRMLGDVVRFGRVGTELLRSADRTTTIGDVLADRRWSPGFVGRYLVPLGASIWSCDPDQFARFPAGALCRFLDNHGLLTLSHRPRWRTVAGGSARYVDAAVAALGPHTVRVRTPVQSVARHDAGVDVVTAEGREHYDHVVLALHADDALDLLVDASPDEKDVLGAFPYVPNDVVLHHDRRMLPRSRRAWASWNYHRARVPSGAVQVTYHLNRLQRIASDREICVTLNRTDEIDPATILWRGTMSHPAYTAAGFTAQDRWSEISGVRRTHYCGAYWGWGFHEDGAASGVRAARAVLGSR